MTCLALFLQMGRGRTTTGMVIACLVSLKLRPPVDPLPHMEKEDGSSNPSGSAQADPLLQGGFPCVRSLTRLLEGGASAKATLDEVLDRCAAMQNLREAILSYQRYLSAAKDEAKKAAAYRRGLEYLERYYVLISYAAYLTTAVLEDVSRYKQCKILRRLRILCYHRWI